MQPSPQAAPVSNKMLWAGRIVSALPVLFLLFDGGAVATHVRAQGSWLTILFPVFIGALIWGGLYLREARLRALVPLRS